MAVDYGRLFSCSRAVGHPDSPALSVYTHLGSAGAARAEDPIPTLAVGAATDEGRSLPLAIWPIFGVVTGFA